ncbi:hypothetical protein F5X96DRAFT_628363 [Biscogniauxia mediterranea]|nr:hypothetical protein F5X96DRAFT_628363 [Biscogniauxia mediterranea]
MTPSTTNVVAALALALTHIFGLVALHGMLYRVGYFGALLQIWREGPHQLPDSSNSILTFYTGIGPLDRLLALASVMFSSVTDGSRPQLSLYAVHFGGQYLGILAVMMIEGLREGNKSNTFRFFSIWACAIQIFSYGLVMPLYGILHLLTSRASQVSGLNLAESTRIAHRASVKMVPEAMVVGYIIPAILMSVPLFPNSLHQWFGGLWQGSPVWAMLVQKAFASYYSKRRRTTSISHLQYDLKVVEKAEGGAAAAGLDAPPPPPPMEETRGSSAYLLSRVYSFAFICCVASQLGPLIVTLAVAVCPAVFPPYLRAAWALTEVFAPPPFYTSEKMRSMASAMHGFFQYDQYVGSTAAVIWASALYVNSRRTPLNGKGWVRLAFVITAFSLGAGPAGAVVWLMWEREQQLLVLNY